jgi:hypothetical protein
VNCSACGNEIRSGEKYTSDSRRTEQMDYPRRFGRPEVTVLGYESEELYHPKCAPKKR